MLRPACVWPILLALAGACAGSGESEPRDPNQPAGKVVELSGQVSAARDGAAVRPLAVGGEVFADDTVTTGPDGAAVILLAHNRVRWSLGSDKSLRVDRSMAWKAKADEGGSAFDDEDPMATASAGRHTDREAGDTAATAQLPAATDEAAPAPPAQAPPGAAGDAIAQAQPKGGGGAESRAPEQKSAPRSKSAAPAPPRKKMLAEGSGAGGGGAGQALEIGGAAAAAPTAPQDAPKPSSSTTSAPAPAPAAATGNLVLGKLEVKGALSAAQVSGRLAHAGRGCRGTVAGKVTLRFEIDGAGKVVNVRLSGSPKVVSPISACVTQAVRALSFPAAGTGTTSVERAIEISLSR
jgi:hypothetical protein